MGRTEASAIPSRDDMHRIWRAGLMSKNAHHLHMGSEHWVDAKISVHTVCARDRCIDLCMEPMHGVYAKRLCGGRGSSAEAAYKLSPSRTSFLSSARHTTSRLFTSAGTGES